MHGPAVVSWLLAAVCAGTGACCLAAARHATRAARSIALTEAAMGLGMAAMAVPPVSGPLPSAFFLVFFGAAALWSGWTARPAGLSRPPAPARSTGTARGGAPEQGGHRLHGLHHALESLAMAYMAAVMLGSGGPHAGHGGSAGGIPAVTGGLLLYFAVFALCTGARILPVAATAAAASAGPAPGGVAPATDPARSPAVADACRLTLALGSFTMLLTL